MTNGLFGAALGITICLTSLRLGKLKIEILLSLKNFTLPWPNYAFHGVWETYIKRQLKIDLFTLNLVCVKPISRHFSGLPLRRL